ncbi:MAG: hypothetical protein K0R55_4165 [Sporomusa sp.]|jgi:hypothetical protein|nr:hypothetical protein [Sporomusa sp.]
MLPLSRRKVILSNRIKKTRLAPSLCLTAIAAVARILIEGYTFYQGKKTEDYLLSVLTKAPVNSQKQPGNLIL